MWMTQLRDSRYATQSGSHAIDGRFAQCSVPPMSDTSQTAPAADTESAFAGDGDLEGLADLAHPVIAESAETLDERPERHALDRVEIHDRGLRHRVIAWLEQHLTRDATNCGRARPDQRAPKPRNRRISRQHHDRPAPHLG